MGSISGNTVIKVCKYPLLPNKHEHDFSKIGNFVDEVWQNVLM